MSLTVTHPIQRRYYVEDLVRMRRSDEQRRYLASQRGAKIDPNPHQIDAVVFALSRIADGGCILADEVGLGKTIEAGLVISQLLAEGARRVLLVTPKPLLGQWKQELYALFGIEAKEGEATAGSFFGDGVFLAGREMVGSEKGHALLREQTPFDLCVVDEAHEIFSGLYKRYDRDGLYDPESKEANMAGRLKTLLQFHNTPVLLLTATPIQNSLTELWGLVQYVDPSSTLLGNLNTFRAVFCGENDRSLVSGQENELRHRLNTVIKRTLRRQAQEFIEKPFVGRYAAIFEYSMTPDERQLYDDVSAYLLEPNLCAFRGGQRRLLLLGFHKRMASSMRALAASLDVVAARLRGQDDSEKMRADLEDDDEIPEDSDDAPPPPPAAVLAELQRVEAFAARARALPTDSKALALLKVVQTTDKMVIFTESLTTQDYLKEFLIQSGLVRPEEITLFRGTNNSPEAGEALARWTLEVKTKNPPSRDIAVRLALVHEFKTRSRIFISSEAGAKGLNLQFCNTLVNYDLPWNPQRIEQRIGRCHRYGQTRDVTVINFLDKDNEAQRLTLEILTNKLDLFGTVLGASDQVLHSGDFVGTVGADFEKRIRDIQLNARSIEEREEELRRFRDEVDQARQEFEEAHQRTAGVIQSRLDEAIRPVFRRIQQEVKRELIDFEHDLERVVSAYLQTTNQGAQIPELQALDLQHPLVLRAIHEARESTNHKIFRVNIAVPEPRGRGRMLLAKVHYDGFERTDRLVAALVLEGQGEDIASQQVLDILRHPISDVKEDAECSVSSDEIRDALDLQVLEDQSEVCIGEEERFNRALAQIERFVEDQLLLLRRRRNSIRRELEDAVEEFYRAVGPEQRGKNEQRQKRLELELERLQQQIDRLEARDDETYQRMRDQAFTRRYAEPEVEILWEAEVTLS